MSAGPGELRAALELVGAVTGAWKAHCLTEVARRGIADRLAGGPRTVAALARDEAADPGALYRILRPLAREGIFAEGPPGTFALNEAARPLLGDAPHSVRHLILHVGGERNRRCWNELPETVATAAPAFARLHGEEFTAYLGRRPGESFLFHRAMAELTGLLAPAIAARLDLTGARSLVDVGGGSGALLGAILTRHPEMVGVDFDLAEALTGAPAVLERHGVSSRCELVAGDLFRGLPPGRDVYLYKQVLHALSDDDAVRALAVCRRAMHPAGRVIAVEGLVAAEGPYMHYLDLQLLLYTEGRERSEDEFAQLFARAGLRLIAARPAAPGLFALTARPT